MRNTAEHDPTRPSRDPERSDAQLDMLHSFAAKLNVLTDTSEIGSAITSELRTIIDYHNCRVYLLQSDRSTLMPIAFRGELTTEYFEEDLDTLDHRDRRGHHRHGRGHPRVAADARRPGGPLLGDDPGHRRRPPGVDAGRADGGRRRRRRGDRAVEPRLRHVRRGGPAHARGARAARGRGVPEREAARGRAWGRAGSGRAPAALAGAHRAAHARRHLPRRDRDDARRSSRAWPRPPTSGTTRPATSGSRSCTRTRGHRCAPARTSPTSPACSPKPCCKARPRRSSCRTRSRSRSRRVLAARREFGDLLVCPLQWEHEQTGALIAVGACRHRAVRRGGDPTRPAASATSRRSRSATPGGSASSSGSTSWWRGWTRLLGGRRRRPRSHVPRRPGRRLVRADDEAGRHGRVVGRPHRGRATARVAVAEVRRAIAEGTDVSVEYRVRTVCGRHAVGPRPRARRARAPGHAAAPRLDGRHHRAQAGRTGPAGIRAQVLARRSAASARRPSSCARSTR